MPQVEHIMIEFDKDGNSKVDKDEFARMYVRVARGDLMTSGLKKAFSQFDDLASLMLSDGDDADAEADVDYPAEEKEDAPPPSNSTPRPRK